MIHLHELMLYGILTSLITEICGRKYIFQSHTDMDTFSDHEDGDPAISATITLAGTISEPHIDQTGSVTLLIQLLGMKVFVVWPPTANNFEWFSNKYGIRYGTIFEAALQRLEFSECIIFKQGQYEHLGPCYIHGVLSPLNSAVAGVPVVHSNLRSQADMTMLWERGIVTRKKGRTIVEKATVKDIKCWFARG